MTDNDFKYMMQDLYRLYFGVKCTYREILENEDAYYKFKAVCRQYLVKEVEPETTLESHLYHLTPDQPAVGHGVEAADVFDDTLAHDMVGKSRRAEPSQIIGSCRSPKSRDKAQALYQIAMTGDNREVAKEAKILFLCVKPQAGVR